MNGFREHFPTSERLLRIVGIWPFQDRAESIGLRIFTTISSMSQIGCKVYLMFSPEATMDTFFECVPAGVVDFSCFMNFVNWIVQQEKMKRLLELMVESWDSGLTPDESAILMSYTEIAQKFALFWIGYLIMAGTSFLTVPLLPNVVGFILGKNVTEPPRLPYPVKYPFMDAKKHFMTTFVHTCFTVALMVVGMVGCVTSFVIFVQHACGLFAVLGHRAETILKNDSGDTSYNSELQNDEKYQLFCKWIDRHNKTIEFAELVEASHKHFFGVALLCNILIISCSGVKMMSSTTSLHLFLGQSVVVMGSLIHLYVDNVFAQRLTNHSLSIESIIWTAPWDESSKRTQMLLSLVSMRASRECSLTCGGLIVMSMENFGAVLKSSASYFTMLRSF